MKTYSEFVQIIERYYEPDEKLASGKTPVEKATQKSRNRARTIATQSPENKKRWIKHYDLTQTKVKHGADNPEINTNVRHKDKNKIKITKHSDGGISLHHKSTGITYHAYPSDHYNDDETSNTIEWNHNKQNKRNLPLRTRLRIARNAQRVWDRHVSHRLPTGFVHNTPVNSYDDHGREKQINRRERLYKRAGFGSMDDEGDQFGKVGREPSPKQKAKGKKRIKPVNPHHAKSELHWDPDDSYHDDDY